MNSSSPTPRLWSPAFLRVVLAQSVFGFGWCMFLVLPKFLTGSLGVGPREVGAANSTSGLAAVATTALLVRVIDRRGGRRAAFLTGSLMLLVSSLGYTRVTHFGPVVYLLQAGVASSYALTFNSAMAFVTDIVPPQRIGQGFGIQSAANLSMNAVSSLIAESVSERFGWRYVFFVSAFAALASFVVGSTLPTTGTERRETHTTESPPYRALSPLFLTSLLMGSAYSAMSVFHQPYAMSLGAKRVGAFFVGFTVAALVMRLGFGNLGDRIGHRRAVLMSLCLYAVVPLGMVHLVPSLLWVYGAGLGFAHGVAYPTLAALASEQAPRSTRGRVIAVASGSFTVGSSAGALIWGQVASHAGYPTVYIAASGAVACALIILSRTPHPRNLSPV